MRQCSLMCGPSTTIDGGSSASGGGGSGNSTSSNSNSSSVLHSPPRFSPLGQDEPLCAAVVNTSQLQQQMMLSGFPRTGSVGSLSSLDPGNPTQMREKMWFSPTSHIQVSFMQGGGGECGSCDKDETAKEGGNDNPLNREVRSDPVQLAGEGAAETDKEEWGGGSAAPALYTCPTAVGGHHFVLKCGECFLKEVTKREFQFYQRMKPHQDAVCPRMEGGPDEVVRESSPIAASTSALSSPLLRECPSPLFRLNRQQRRFFQQQRKEGRALSANSGNNASLPSASAGEAAFTVEDAYRCLAPFTPLYRGSVTLRKGSDGWKVVMGSELPAEGGEGETPGSTSPFCCVRMLVLEDICHGFRHPCVLDMKMGKRQFGAGACEAKRNSKSLKASLSTTGLHGIRLAGYRRYDLETDTYASRGKLECRYLPFSELQQEMNSFLAGRDDLRVAFRTQVEHLLQAFESQRDLRFFTSSLIFVYDADRPMDTARIAMVDFAFTYERGELRERGDEEAVKEWDEGYIAALRSIILIL